MKIECGDIIKTTWGIILVEKIKDNGTLIGHELKGMREFWSRNIDKDVEILNSDFIYKSDIIKILDENNETCDSATIQLLREKFSPERKREVD